MITKVKKIKNLGIFHDYSATASTPDLNRYNLIYGWNGSGKTTLSRLFCALESGVSERFPSLEYKIECVNGTVLKQNQPYTDAKVMVFNQDYIRENAPSLDDPYTQTKHIYLLGKELKEKEENKHIYDAMAAVKKPKIAELSTILAPVLEKAGFIEFSLDKPEMGKDVVISFSCLDGKSERSDYDSEKTLKRTIDKAIADTNWRLKSDGIHFRLGYLSGRLKAYEREEDIKALVMKSKKLKAKQDSSRTNVDNATSIDDGKGRRIIL